MTVTLARSRMAYEIDLAAVLVAFLQFAFHCALLPVVQHRLQNLLAVVTHVLPPGSMRGLVERRVQALVPSGIAEGDGITEWREGCHVGSDLCHSTSCEAEGLGQNR